MQDVAFLRKNLAQRTKQRRIWAVGRADCC